MKRFLRGGRGLSGLLCATLAFSCASHVSLAVPPPDAPVATRAEAYRQLHSTSATQTVTSLRGAGTSFDNELTLANGTSVVYAEDILPVVSADSESAEYARSSLSKRSKGKTCGWLSAVSTLAFGAIMLGLLSSSGSGNRTLANAGLITTGLGASGFGIANYLFLSGSSDDAMEAYRHYNNGLQKKLSICVGASCGSSVIRDSKSESAPPDRK
ncbi:MAG: hypothetical protein ABIQ16_21320 [Polyangiaceae bacterium]